jgi:hypothetical protein
LGLLAVVLLCLIPKATTQQRDGRVSLTVEVTDSQGRFISRLRSGDFRLIEDGIVQKIATFSERQNGYLLSYVPKANPNQGFRRVHVQILSGNGEFRVRHMPGYRPQQLRR